MTIRTRVHDRMPGSTGQQASPSRPATASSNDGSFQQTNQVMLLTFGGAMLAGGLQQRSLGGTMVALAGGTLIYRIIKDNPQFGQMFSFATTQQSGAPANAPELEQIITIDASADEIYRRWLEPTTLPQIMAHIATVTVVDDERFHWALKTPFGEALEWDSRVVETRPGEFIRWESLPGAQLPSTGQVRFRPAPGNRGTEVALQVRFDPPAGVFGDTAIKFFNVLPKALIANALRRLKSLIETGEIPTTRGQPAARNSGRDQ
jgi:uncharacterized membrane protein